MILPTLNRRIAFALLVALLAGALPVEAKFPLDPPPKLVGFTPQRRNHLFYVGETPVFTFLTNSASGKPILYEVRDYWGNLIASGVPAATAPQISLPGITTPGWYKIYLYQAADQGAPWGTSIGGTFFSIIRNDPNFPAQLAVGTSGGGDSFGDEVIRGVAGIGPQRIRVTDLTNPDGVIATIQQTVDINKAMYLPYDPVRKRALLVSVYGGVNDASGAANPTRIANLVKIVTQFKDSITYWEGYNEPQSHYTPTDYINKELIPFYNAVKSVSPDLKVVGPAVVSLLPQNITWMSTFLDQAGSNYDAFSFHAYNAINGDLGMVRRTMADLKTMLAAHGKSNMELWQTEQGYFAAMYSSYQPRHQAVWTMLQMMVFEQNGIRKSITISGTT